jgi:2-dehydropantoate 2-reductase
VNVSLVCRSNYAAIAANGVQLQTHTFGDYTFRPHAAYPSIAAAASATAAPPDGWDYVVVTTKALPDLVDDAAAIEPLVRRRVGGRPSCVVLIQNGVGVEEPHRRRFPRCPVVSAVTVISAEQTAPGVVRQNRWTRISLGPYSDGLGGASSADARALSGRGAACVAELVGLFTRAGRLRDAEPHDEVGLQLVRWHKLAINAAMNPSAVLAGGLPSASMVADPALRDHLRACMREVLDAAPRILGRAFPAELAGVDAIIRSTERNAGGRPSMLVDWEAGRPMELEAILGNPVRIAKRHGVEMPRLQSLYALLRSAQAQRDAKAGRAAPSSSL